VDHIRVLGVAILGCFAQKPDGFAESTRDFVGPTLLDERPL
jgi:hypothetical protein